MKIRTKFFVLIFSIIKTLNLYPQIKFTSPEEMIQYGKGHSTKLFLNKELIENKIKSAKLSITNFLPQFDFSWNENDNIVKNENDYRTKNISANITQLLFDNGKTRLNYLYNRQTALDEFYQNEENIKSYELQLIEYFYQLILTKKTIDLKEQLIKSTEDEISIAQYKFDSGIGLESDLIEYQINQHQLQNEIITDKQDIETIKSAIKELLNISPEENFEVEYSTPINEVQYSNLLDNSNKIIEHTVLKNTELKQLQNQINYQKQVYKLNNRFYFPTISLTGGISFSGTNYPLTQPDYSLKLTFSFNNLPFINPNYSNSQGMSIQNSRNSTSAASTTITPEINYFVNKKIEKLSIKQMEENEKETINLIKNEIISLINQHDNLLNSIYLQTQTISLLEKKLTISKYEKDNGLIRATDFINSQLELLEYKQSLLQSKIQIQLLSKKISYLSGEENLYD